MKKIVSIFVLFTILWACENENTPPHNYLIIK
jgi:hypothetical protein